MSIHSLIACDQCPATLRVPHAACPRPTARMQWWVTITVDGETTDLCPDCGRDVE